MSLPHTPQGRTPQLAYPFEEGMCDLLGLGKTTAYKELHEGRIATYLVGRRRYVEHQELLAYIARQRRATASGAA
jgi:excisionase family DNA binding protein